MEPARGGKVKGRRRAPHEAGGERHELEVEAYTQTTSYGYKAASQQARPPRLLCWGRDRSVAPSGQLAAAPRK